ncbi:MAG: GMC family oxidoreductase N-terminal domain-containing protein, partial [Gammaproteobacteria bacterium]
DYVVVGGGSAGCVVAARLAEDPHASVCLIEAGPNDRELPQVQNVSRWSELLLGALDFAYAIEPQLRGNDRLVHSRGRVLGGCSSHNSCIALRPSARDFERWEALGARGWGPKDVEPFFARVLERVHLELGNTENPLSNAFVESAQCLAFPFVDFSLPFSEGVGWLPLNKRGGQRDSASNAYLHRPGVPENLEIRTETRVVAIKWEGQRAAELALDDATMIRTEGALVLAAGVFDTPKLLLLSGVGPPDDVTRIGIPVHHALEGVGRHLVDHPEGVLIWELERPLPRASSQKYEAALFADPANAGRAEIMLHFGLEPFDMNT